MPFDEAQAAMLIAKLQEENRKLRVQLGQALARGDQLADDNERLKKRLEELEREAARQAAPFRRRKEKKVDPAKKKRPGRKPGHRGARRAVPDRVDQEIEVPLTCCPGCAGELHNLTPLTQYIEEIPPVRPQVTRLVTWWAKCPTCGEVRSTHPLQTSVG